MGYGSFNVIENDTIRKLRYGFLFAFIAYAALSCIVSEIKRSKIAILVNVTTLRLPYVVAIPSVCLSVTFVQPTHKV